METAKTSAGAASVLWSDGSLGEQLLFAGMIPDVLAARGKMRHSMPRALARVVSQRAIPDGAGDCAHADSRWTSPVTSIFNLPSAAFWCGPAGRLSISSRTGAGFHPQRPIPTRSARLRTPLSGDETPARSRFWLDHRLAESRRRGRGRKECRLGRMGAGSGECCPGVTFV